MPRSKSDSDRVVISGIGLVASAGNDRESVWRAVREGRSYVRKLRGLPGIPDDLLIGAPVDLELEAPDQLKVLALCDRTAAEALGDAQIDPDCVPSERFGCAISAIWVIRAWCAEQLHLDHLYPPPTIPWWHQWLPNSACSRIANRHRLYGPRMCHSTACASGLIEILSAVRAIEDGQCDLALAGSAEVFHPLFAAGFQQMRVLAHHEDPRQACRPFDLARRGFVMGEGAALFVLERLGHAVARRAPIYAEVAGGRLLATAHHITGLDIEADALAHLISETLRVSDLVPGDVGYINAHGTGTQQNDLAETRAIRRAMGMPRTCCASARPSRSWGI